MTDQIVRLGPEYFPRPTSGIPVAGGSIYIGDPDTDPEIPGNQITVNALQENGSTVPISQPILTSGGGVPLYNGAPVTLLVSESYSLKVLDAFDVQVYYVPETIVTATIVAATVEYTEDLIGLINVSSPVDDQTHTVLSFFDGLNKGGGDFYWDSTIDKATANGVTIVDPDNIGGFDGTIGTRDAFLTAQGGGVGFGCWLRILNGPVNPYQSGAIGNGTTDDTQPIQSVFTSSNDIEFLDGSYFMSGQISKTADNVKIGFGNASIIGDSTGSGSLFSFGAFSDTPNNTGLSITGGTFELDGATVNNIPYVTVGGISDFTINGVTLNNVGNGGIHVLSGCEKGLISDITIIDKSGYGTVRGIWLDGSSASDYASQLVDLESITRNATPLPVFGVKDVTVENCNIELVPYGVYLINAHNCKIIDNNIDISGVGALRCIAINNYSPRTIVSGNTLTSDRSSTAILITQASDDVLIVGNLFQGDFGGNRDIYVQYLAEAVIDGNRFRTDTTQRIQINMGGSVVIKNNDFDVFTSYTQFERVVKISTIDTTAPANTGDTATTLPGMIFMGNVCRNIVTGVEVDTPTSTLGNIPGLENVVVRDNYFYNFDLATGGSEYPLFITANGSTYEVDYSFLGNTIFPKESARRNEAVVSGSGFNDVRVDVQAATFTSLFVSGGGAITTSKIDGGNFSLVATRSGLDVLLTPRTIDNAAGAQIARVVAIIPITATIFDYDIHVSGSGYGVRFYNSIGSQLSAATEELEFYTILQHANT